MKNSISSEVVLWGFTHFVLYLWCFLPTKFPFFCIFLCIDLPMNVRTLIGKGSLEAGKGRTLSSTFRCLFVMLPRYLYCLFINWSTIFSDLQKRFNGLDSIKRGLLSSHHLCPTQTYFLKLAF